MINPELSTPEMLLNLAIGQFDTFKQLYEKLTGKRVPGMTVLGDELGSLGIDDGDREKAADIFAANIRYLRLVREISGSEFVMSLSEVEDKLSSPESKDESSIETDLTQVETDKPLAASTTASEPSVHIDVQIHIDSTASAEQIDQIFASMARHLYGKGG